MRPPLQVSDSKLLKKDVFGQVSLAFGAAEPVIVRDVRTARPWLRWLARRLLRQEARALAVLEGLDGCPEMLRFEPDTITRQFIAGNPMQEARPVGNAAYFRQARRLLGRIHRRGLTHNDLAKEPNWLVTPDGRPAVVDFQLARQFSRRSLLFRIAAREDIRHLLKHKRTYCPELLTKREREMLENPSILARLWRSTGKKAYLFVTRRILNWEDREGTHERQALPAPAALYSRPTCLLDGSVNFCHLHNVVEQETAGVKRGFGIRVSLPAGDTFNTLLGQDWERIHWFVTEEERDSAFDNMAERHGYYRHTDTPTQVLEKISR